MSGTLVFLREGYKRTSRCQRRRGSNLGRRLGGWLKEPLGFDLSEMKSYLRFKIIVCLTFFDPKFDHSSYSKKLYKYSQI